MNSGPRGSRPEHVKTDCFACSQRGQSDWCGVDEAGLRTLNQGKRTLRFRAGSALFEQGDACLGVFVLQSGTVAIRKHDAQGNAVLLRLCHAGQTVGYRDYFTHPEFTTSADALSDAEICFVPREAIESLLARDQALGKRFFQRIAEDLEHAEDAILRASALDVRTRLAHLLLMLRDRYGSVDDEGCLRLELPLARQDIAALLGARPETITRCIHALEQDGVARFSGRTVIVPDLDALLDEVETDPA